MGELDAQDTAQRDRLVFWKDNPGCLVGTDHVRDWEWQQVDNLLQRRGLGPGVSSGNKEKKWNF